MPRRHDGYVLARGDSQCYLRRIRCTAPLGLTMTKYGPKGDLSPSLGQPCPLCHCRFTIGDFTTLMRSTRDGRFANDGVEVHWDCATGKMPKLRRPASGTAETEATTKAERPITGKRS